MQPRVVTNWLCRGVLVFVSLASCKALDERTVTLHNGEECSNLRQCESLHCELAAEQKQEADVHICCSISCALGSACAPSGTSCVVCARGECESACAGEGCATDEPATKTSPDEGHSTVNTTVALQPTTASDVHDGVTMPLGTSDWAATGQLNDAGHDAPSSQLGPKTASGVATSDAGQLEAATDRSSTTSTGSSDEVIPQDEIPECGEQLLINGDFENEMQAWTEETSYVGLSQRVHPMVVSADDDSVAQYAASAQSGSYFAYVGGVPDDADRGHHSAIVQSIVVPTDAAALWLRGYIWISTDDELDDEYDFGFIQLERTPQDEQYRQFEFWTNQDASTGWVAFEAVLEELGDLRGKRLRFLVGSITDEMGMTRFWFDALKLEGLCD